MQCAQSNGGAAFLCVDPQEDEEWENEEEERTKHRKMRCFCDRRVNVFLLRT